MANVTVARSTDQAIIETVQQRQFIGGQDILLNPNLAPVLAMTTRIGHRKGTTKSVRVEWIEDDFYSVWGQANEGADKAAAATTLTVSDATLFALNDLVAVPKGDAMLAAEEIFQVTGIAGSVLTITRGIGGTGADTIPATGDLRIVAGAFPEGAAFPSSRSTSKVVKTSYTQIFRRPVVVTKTMAAQAQFGAPNERIFQRKKALEEHLRNMESAFFWSEPSEALATPGSVRTTMGLKGRVVTNVYNASNNLTEQGFETFAELAFAKYFEGNEKVLTAAKRVISALDHFSLGHLRTQQDSTVLGLKTKRYVSTHGEFMIIRDLLLEDGPAGGLGWGDEAYALDMNSIYFCPLSGNGENRDTHLLTDVVKAGADSYSDEYITEGAWAIRFEQRHARLYNARNYS